MSTGNAIQVRNKYSPHFQYLPCLVQDLEDDEVVSASDSEEADDGSDEDIPRKRKAAIKKPRLSGAAATPRATSAAKPAATVRHAVPWAISWGCDLHHFSIFIFLFKNTATTRFTSMWCDSSSFGDLRYCNVQVHVQLMTNMCA